MTNVPQSVRETIHSRFDELSASERKVARALLANYPAAGLGTAAELAHAAQVSAPTVIRCADRLGYSGHVGLQRALLQEVGNEYGSPLRQMGDKGGRGTLDAAPAMRASLTEIVSTTFDQLPRAEFDRLIALLSDESRPVRAIGGRFTRLAAEYLCAHLAMLRPGVQLLRLNTVESQTQVIDIEEGSVVVVFDVRRHSPETAAWTQAVAARNAVIVAVTDEWVSPVAHMADVVLPVCVESSSPFDSIVGVMALVESVIAGVTGALGERCTERLAAFEAMPFPRS